MQSRSACWASFFFVFFLRLRAVQAGTRVYMRFPCWQVRKRGYTVTVATQYRLVYYSYLKIDVVFSHYWRPFILCFTLSGTFMNFPRHSLFDVFPTKDISLSLLFPINNRSFWVLPPSLNLRKYNLNNNT
jgi:hypothetical protein